MTIQNIISHVDGVMPNAYDNATKLLWINELEYNIQTEVFNQTEDFTSHAAVTAETLLGDEWSEVYIAYLKAKIAQANGEWSEYANLAAIYDMAVGEYLRYYCRNNLDPEE